MQKTAQNIYRHGSKGLEQYFILAFIGMIFSFR